MNQHTLGPAPIRCRRFRRLAAPAAALAVVLAGGGSAGVVLARADGPAVSPPPPVPAGPAAIEPVESVEPAAPAPAAAPEAGPATGPAPEATAPVDTSPVRAPRARFGNATAVADVEDDLDPIPSLALAAYQRSEVVMAQAAPRCRLDWTVLAAVGHLLTEHGQVGGDHALDEAGRLEPVLTGPPVRDERGRRVADTDAGELDGDPRHDRAMGPMLLAPAVWRQVGVDADLDGERDPQNIHDAALAVAVLLCVDGENLQRPRHLAAALERVNPDPAFIDAVPEVAAQYAAGAAQPAPIPTFAPAPVVPIGVVRSRPAHPSSTGSDTTTDGDEPSLTPAEPTEPTGPPEPPQPPEVAGKPDRPALANDPAIDEDAGGTGDTEPEPPSAPAEPPAEASDAAATPPEPETSAEPAPSSETEPDTASAPGPAPEPAAEPEPVPDPPPAPAPAVEPEPAPVPEPRPAPAPAAGPEPEPATEPEPIPEPEPTDPEEPTPPPADDTGDTGDTAD